MAFDLPNLPYAYDALETSGMSKETLEFHHDLHHKAYVDNGNKLIAGTQWEDKSLEEIITGTYDAGAIAQNGVFNNASQHWNHVQFWEMMGPTGRAMPSELESALTEQFGSVDAFKEAFTAAGIGQFGSGWCWLAVKDGKVIIAKSANGESPLVQGATPILGCDVWEHSYYIDYRNRRPDYLKAFIENLVNWDYAVQMYDKATG